MNILAVHRLLSNTVQYSTVQHSTVQYSTVQCSVSYSVFELRNPSDLIFASSLILNVQGDSSESKTYSQSPFNTPPRGDRQSDAGRGSGTGTIDRVASLSSAEQEQHIAYLRQAFCGFVKAKEAVEMEHLGEPAQLFTLSLFLSFPLS